MEEQRTDTILNSLAEGVITVDKEFKITFINEAASLMTGFHKDEVIGKICKNVFKSEFCLENCPIARILKFGKSIFDFDSQIECKDSTPVPIRLNAALLRDENNNPSGGVITFRDISILKKIEGILNDEFNFHGLISNSKSMKEIFTLVKQISDSAAPVLITGETGTGKELIADAIQNLSKRVKNNYVKVNCSVIPQNLLASELFGHLKGAFTDAQKDRVGRFELAHNGTIFLDEIGEMPLQMQPQILRVLQDGTFERLGESITRSVNVRIITATNIDLEKTINEGRFREDLFYRLNVIHIELPPLRKRTDDIPLLTNHFLRKYSLIYKKNIPHIDDECIEHLMQWHWPGNIRELENAVEFAVIRNKTDKDLCICSFPQKIRENIYCDQKHSEKLNIQTPFENSNLLALLNQYKWNKTKVAQILGVDRTTLWRKLKSMGIK
ncbi:MAG TPA: sigma-54-dependent Fis family transcriptional regulator [Ignavibacteriales bacterium]|nr:sigma-54-dependent Fis family transcriptional regulator [Ignavibacteriales bacterium]